MRDIIDIHRSNIAKAGVELAEDIAAATLRYTATVAASEAALEVAIEQRVAAFNGAPAVAPRKLVEKLDEAPRGDGDATGEAGPDQP
jgi:hypothetical protein